MSADKSKMFTDETFCGASALGDINLPAHLRPVTWVRLSEARQFRGVKLFTTIEADNILQGPQGDCWLWSSIAVLADYPGYIRTLLTDEGNGKYSVRLWDIRTGWETVVIDDKIPVGGPGQILVTARMHLEGEGACLWPLLMQKAVAKFVGNYGRLVGGSSFWAWQVLTGQACQAMWVQATSSDRLRWTRLQIAVLEEWTQTDAGHERWRTTGMRDAQQLPLGEVDAETLFDELADCCQASYPMTASIPKDRSGARDHGLVDCHAYSIIQVVCADDHKFVELRNPHGVKGKWTGRWGNDSDDWRRKPWLARDLRHRRVDDGRFFMLWEDFPKFFTDISVCPVTLPCPLNTQLTKKVEGSSDALCPKCDEPYTKRWGKKTDGTWDRFEDGQVCYVCIRTTTRATNPRVSLTGVHSRPGLAFAPPRPPKPDQDICKYDARCYRRDPEHFCEFFHPSFLPPAPPCSNMCGRTARSTDTVCCRCCKLPDFEVLIPDSCPSRLQDLRGIYLCHVLEPIGRVWRHKSRDSWLWNFAGPWKLAPSLAWLAENRSIFKAAGDDHAPFNVDMWKYRDAAGAWKDSKMTVRIAPSFKFEHHLLCNHRVEREEVLVNSANAALALKESGADSRRDSRRGNSASRPS